ncbi:hypothetical protein G7075_15910 [Phycicoccus sp. HDW14]|uniref:DUF2795 domain-containing protein n=1 Tax=Phycicoccus sp. HDW14 TaxID=2714941 RepID=UPI001407AC64|nr:hypothetical protein [Phycicoccus sp. HDW14]QIM22277.1 hypothetical protein G7075_15910 [Phycicoccus sp. HDW14]
MTTVHAGGLTAHEPGDPALAADLQQLRGVLAVHPFPARQDDLIAACLVAGAPARLCCRLARLDRTHDYASLDEVCADVVATTVPTTASTTPD